MTLSYIQCQKAKAAQKVTKLADGGGLYLEVWPQGYKYWRLKYRFAGKEKRLSLGVFPDIGPAEAREGREKAKKLLAAGIDPSNAKQDQKRQMVLEHQNTFEAVAREWHEKQKTRWSAAHAENVLQKLETDLFPQFGHRPIAEVTAPMLLDALRKIEARGAYDMARRAKQIAGQVFRYGIATGRGTRDHAADLKDALTPTKTKHFAALDVREMPELLTALRKNDARLYARTRRAIQFSMLTFVRPSEAVEARWDEIDLKAGEWVIPAERMKMGKAHIVPLARQTIELLEEQQRESGSLNTLWVFPGLTSPRKPMSNGTVLMALKRMGFGGRMTAHGFRAFARTYIREKLGYDADVIERQMAHAPRSKVVAAYDRAKFLDQRRTMMQDWADFTDTLNGGNVVRGEFRKAR